MKNRSPIRPKGPMLLWSVTLLVLNTIGTLKFIPERFSVVKNYGWDHPVCTMELLHRSHRILVCSMSTCQDA